MLASELALGADGGANLVSIVSAAAPIARWRAPQLRPPPPAVQAGNRRRGRPAPAVWPCRERCGHQKLQDFAYEFVDDILLVNFGYFRSYSVLKGAGLNYAICVMLIVLKIAPPKLQLQLDICYNPIKDGDWPCVQRKPRDGVQRKHCRHKLFCHPLISHDMVVLQAAIRAATDWDIISGWVLNFSEVTRIVYNKPRLPFVYRIQWDCDHYLLGEN